jgi:hypothetical protein
MLLRCSRCSQLINLLGKLPGRCPACSAELEGPAAPETYLPAAASKRAAKATGDLQGDLMPPVVRAPDVGSRSRRSKGKPGDRRPVDKPVCWFCNGAGSVAQRTCSKCKGFGYQ